MERVPTKEKIDDVLVEKKGANSGAWCSPATATTIALVSLVTIVVVKVQLTAWLFSMSKFPTVYSFYSAIVTDVMLIPMFLLFPKQWGVPSLDMFGPPKFVFTLIIIFTTFDMAFTNIALANISVALQQCIAATNPFWTVMIESVLYGKFQNPIIYGTVYSGLVVGAILVSVSDITRVNVSPASSSRARQCFAQRASMRSRTMPSCSTRRSSPRSRSSSGSTCS